MTRFPPLRGIALLLAATSPLPAVAQGGAIVQPLTPNADRLSEQMRTLGRSPNDLSALIEAGRLSGKLGDVDAAMQFLARAERVAPADPRIRAARAATLVGMERPGEALALFDQAERAGVPMAPYAAERGLAYDLLGYTANAQRDYRLALSQGPDDELTRRLALSMGIEGDVAGATALLDPLLRQNDRAAWRVRAFVLAMSGDAAGADRITASMLPGFSASLSPFFRRLPQLSAADRAFAVHFGRLAPTPERIADARFAPAVVPVPRAAPPVAVAAATPAVQQPAPARRSPTAAERRRAAQLARQAQQAEAKRVADAQAAQLAKARADEAARRTALAQAEAQRLRDAEQLAEQARLAEATRQEAARVAARQAEERRVAAAALAARDAAAADAPVAPPVQVATTEAPVPVRLVEQPPAQPSVTTASPPVQVAAVAPPAPTPGFSTPEVTPAASRAAATVAARSAANDEVLARIIRNLDIPAAELGVAPPAAPAASAPALPTAAEQAAAAEAARAAARQEEADARAAAAKKAADARKLAETKKAAEARKLADAKKAEAAAEAKKEAALKKADPERHWVQVAGGANVADLPKAWKALAAKAPALKTRQAWTTPLRFTNRLLAGPFKSDDEAQAFVNTLGKSGLSAFTFTSPAGQKVARVPAS